IAIILLDNGEKSNTDKKVVKLRKSTSTSTTRSARRTTRPGGWMSWTGIVIIRKARQRVCAVLRTHRLFDGGHNCQRGWRPRQGPFWAKRRGHLRLIGREEVETMVPWKGSV